MEDADISLCVLSIPELRHSVEGNGLASPLYIPEDIKSKISPDKTLLLLNKSDLGPLNPDAMNTLVSQLAHSLGVPHVWAVSLTTSTGVDSFLKEFGDVLKTRSVRDLRDLTHLHMYVCTDLMCCRVLPIQMLPSL